MATERRQFIGWVDSSANEKFLGLPREITIDLFNKTIRVHDGQKEGGFPLAREDLANVPQSSRDDLVLTISEEAKEMLLAETQPRLTSQQLQAVNSGITASKVEHYDSLNHMVKHISIAAAEWQASQELAGYEYSATIQVDDTSYSLANKIPFVVFAPADASSGNYSPSCKFNGTDEVTIYAKELPSDTVRISAVIFL